MDKLQDKDWLLSQYYEKGLSFQQIADELGTNKQKVRRAFIKCGGIPREKGEAQSIAINSGRAIHPTKGKERSEEVKLRISKGMSESWASLTDEELQRRSDIAKENWELLPDWKKDEIHKLAGQAVREASTAGSKLEKSIFEHLTKAGFNVQYHVEDLVLNVRLQVDMLVMSHRTVIEIDGPSHFLPIWGQDKLDKNIRADEEKNGLLILNGFAVIRVKQINDNVSLQKEHEIVNRIVRMLKNIESSFPTIEHRLMQIEV